MARGINKVILIGNLGQDPDIRYTANGTPVANLSLATDESYKDKQSGQLVPRTEWHKISMFGKLAEIAGQYLKKGSKVYIEGRLQTRQWEKDGQTRYTTEILVDINGQMQMLDGKPPEGKGAAPKTDAAKAYRQAREDPQAPPPVDDFDDDIPF